MSHSVATVDSHFPNKRKNQLKTPSKQIARSQSEMFLLDSHISIQIAMMAIDSAVDAEGYTVPIELFPQGKNSREHQVGLIHEMESRSQSAAGGITSQ